MLLIGNSFQELKLKQNGGPRKTFIPKNVILFPWCSLIFTELDFNCYEQVTNVWVKLVDRMSVDGGGTAAAAAARNVNQTVKELTKEYGASELSVFKWADFLLKLDVNSSVFSVALLQYWRLIRQCDKIAEHNPALLNKLKIKLLIPVKCVENAEEGFVSAMNRMQR